MELYESMLPLKSEWLRGPEHHTPTELTVFFQDTVLNDGSGLNILITDNNFTPTPLLFQAAISHCSVGSYVVYIRQQAFTKLPLQVHGMPSAQPSTLKCLKMLYLTTLDELVNYLADVHTLPVLPHTLIVEGLHLYAITAGGDSVNHTFAKLCALLKDACLYIRKKEQPRCQVIASLEDRSNAFQGICQRFAETTSLIMGCGGEDDGVPAFSLSPAHRAGVQPPHTLAVQLAVHNDCLKIVQLVRNVEKI